MAEIRGTMLRIIVALWLVVCIPLLSAAPFWPGHAHSTAGAHACTICQCSHMPLDAAPSAPQVWPPVHGPGESRSDSVDRLNEAPEVAARGRAPPSN
jgi:hypothetical protein